MNKKIIAYLVVLVIIVIIAFIILSGSKGTSIIDIIHPSTSTVSSSTTMQSTVQTTQPVSTAFSFCVPKAPATFPIYNGNFSTGTYKGWNVSGKAFGTAPMNLTHANSHTQYYGAPWSGYNGTFAASTFQSGFIPGTGNITSGVFKVTEPYLNFQIVSPQNKGIYVEVLTGNSVFEVAQFNTFNGSITSNYFTTFMNASINLSPILCDNASVRIVSNVQASTQSQYSYVSAGNFYLGPSQVLTPGIVTNVDFPNGG